MMNSEGRLLAAPGINRMTDPNLGITSFETSMGKNPGGQEAFQSNSVVGGILNYMSGQQTDIIASVPLGISDLRLNVHQNFEVALENTRKFFKGVLIIALLISAGISLIGFFLVDRIVRNYESKLEIQAR